jgi:hypothetical protein
MEGLIVLLIIIFLVGLLFRSKGSSFLDTMSSGCGCIVGIIILGAMLVIFAMAS